MRRSPPLLFRWTSRKLSNDPIVQIKDATFYRYHPSSSVTAPNPALFPQLDFLLPSFGSKENWSILGSSSSGKTTLLEVIRGQHICVPPTARTFPYLSAQNKHPDRAIQYVGFGSGRGGLSKNSSTKGAYLSSRYESRREIDDFSLKNYLLGQTDLNAVDEDVSGKYDSLARIVKDLRLESLLDLPVSSLSNGQTRRARIARGLLEQPELLLLDEPFMGLDPHTLVSLSEILGRLTDTNSPRLLLSLRPQDNIPEWITHLMVLGPNFTIPLKGPKDEVLQSMKDKSKQIFGVSSKPVQTDEAKLNNRKKAVTSEPLIEMSGVKISYGDRDIIGNANDASKESGLWWTVRRGERWGVFGSNGSGKTTLLSLICSDHPQTYSQPVTLFGSSRLPTPGQPGISIFDIQARIGHSSPEIHAFYPKSQSVRQVIENAWAETFLSKPTLTFERDQDVDSLLRWFQAELNPSSNAEQPLACPNAVKKTVLKQAGGRISRQRLEQMMPYDTDDLDWADSLRFGEIPFSAQRVALLLRAIARKPDVVILDESFSGMDELVRDKCLLFLEHGESRTQYTSEKDGAKHILPSVVQELGRARFSGLSPSQALVCVSHVREEVPGTVREWIRLPEQGSDGVAKFGKLDGPLSDDWSRWTKIWE